MQAPPIAQVARLASAYEVTVLVDELYSRLLHDGRRFPHLAAEPGMFAHTVTLLEPSKTESLSGYRLGVVVVAPEIVSRVQSIMALRAPGLRPAFLRNGNAARYHQAKFGPVGRYPHTRQDVYGIEFFAASEHSGEGVRFRKK